MMEIARRTGLRPPVLAMILAIVVGGVIVFAVVNVLDRIHAAEMGFCHRLQGERDETNRNGAIIYVQMKAVADNARAHGHPAAATEYLAIANLPGYQPPTDCGEAVDDPSGYEPPTRIPFGMISGSLLANILSSP